jgi:hypothetical protein
MFYEQLFVYTTIVGLKRPFLKVGWRPGPEKHILEGVIKTTSIAPANACLHLPFKQQLLFHQ